MRGELRVNLYAPPPRQPGERLMQVRRRAGEDAWEAIERVSSHPWWAGVVRRFPYCTEAYWIWTVKA